MTQKTLMVKGKRYTGKQVAKLFDAHNMTDGGDYIISINGKKYFANYREILDDYFAPICSANNANALALMPDNGTYRYTICLRL